jgi:hypothetical protein
MRTIEVLKNNLIGKQNPNSFTIVWDNETLPCGTTWSTGFDTYEIIALDWGFQLIKDNGKIAPPTQINFGKYVTESNFDAAFNRAMDFVKHNCNVNEGLPSFIWGD